MPRGGCASTRVSEQPKQPSATRTWQIDGGIRWTPIEGFQLELGAFDIHKPYSYFNIDANNAYTVLGRVEYRGVETSLSLRGSNVTVFVGAVRLSPRIESDIAEPGTTANIPLDSYL